MPRRAAIEKEIDLPSWLKTIEDTCLSKMLIEALVARKHAIQAGALDQRDARGELKSADETIDQIAFGRFESPVACKKAADALRKYTHSLDLAAGVVVFHHRAARRR